MSLDELFNAENRPEVSPDQRYNCCMILALLSIYSHSRCRCRLCEAYNSRFGI